MPEGIFHEMHRRRNISPPATTDQALRAAQPKGRPRARLLLKHILLHLIPALPALCLMHDTWQIFMYKIGSLQDFCYICASLGHFWFAIHDQMA